MEQIILYRNIFLEQASMIIDRTIVIFSRITGTSQEISQIILLVLICYLIGITLLIKIHRKLLKKEKNVKKESAFAYDNILYLIAQAEQKNQGANSLSPLQEIFASEEKNYFAHHDMIIQSIRNLEAETKQILFTPEMEKNIASLRKKMKTAKIVQKILGTIISITTAGMYMVFW